MKTLARIVLGIVALPVAVAAQDERMGPPDHSAAAREAMKAVGFLVGEWEGEGWMQMGTDEPEKFESWEKVEWKLDGLALLVEGRHLSLEEGGEGELVHHALAMITWNADEGRYDFRSFTNRGLGGNFPGEIAEDGSFVWSMSAGGRDIRYAIRLDAQGAWTELGQVSPPGTQDWYEFFGMRLLKKE